MRLRLTLDADVQRAVEDGFRAFGYNGAAVVLEPATGEVLAFASVPASNASHDESSGTAFTAPRPGTTRAP